jgi:hypothetical protein
MTMNSKPDAAALSVAKRILVVAHDRPLRESRLDLLQREGYCVQAVCPWIQLFG